MATTTEDEPQVTLRLRSDGTGEVVVNGVAEAIRAAALPAARAQGLAQVQELAATTGDPVRFVAYDPEGQWHLVMAPDGRVSEDDGEADVVPARAATPAPAPTPASAPTPAPAPTPVAPAPAPAPLAPATAHAAVAPAPEPQPQPVAYRVDPEPAPAPAPAVPAPAAPTAPAAPARTEPEPARPRRAYDSGYVMGSIVPVTRVAKSTRGWRSLLGVGPSKKELAERADRAAACQTFGRPVTIVVADPRGGSGKTTTSLLLAGAFGNARGGGVLALENHELRGTMHLRTQAEGEVTNIRSLLQAQRYRGADGFGRLGDLSRFVRHQVAGQYDVLVSATRNGRALTRREFDEVHTLMARFYPLIIVDTANNESAENWRAAVQKADALVVPVKWRNDYSVPAIEMLEELEHSNEPRLVDLVRRAVVVASHGQGDLDARCRQHLKPYFTERTQAVIEIEPDPHIAEGNVIQHDQLTPATRHQANRIAAEVANAIRAALDAER